MKSKTVTFENFKKNAISKSKLSTVFGGDADPDKSGATSSSSSGTGATIAKPTQNPLPVLGQKV